MPPKPSAAALRKASTGNVSVSSHSRANGIISSRANCRAVAWKARCSSVSSKSIGRPLAYRLASGGLGGQREPSRACGVYWFWAPGDIAMADDNAPKGPDLAQGIPSTDLAEGKMLAGHVGDEEVLLARQNGRVFAIGAQCTHYHGPLAEGLLVNGTVRCPWHQACFDLSTGEALEAPALSPLPCYAVSEGNGKIVVTGKKEQPTPKTISAKPQRVVIVGGGAAGFACAEMLRRRGFGGTITMLSNDAAAPVDRPNLSKDYLAGTAPEAWVPLREDGWYAENKIDLKLKTEVSALDARGKTLTLGDGTTIGFDRLLLATGAEPVKLEVPGAQARHVHTLRSLADSRGIIEAATNAKRAVVIGASFIGLEVAASLRARDIEVTVIAPDKRPLERVFGPQIADFVRALHEEHGVKFVLENGVKEIATNQVLP